MDSPSVAEPGQNRGVAVDRERWRCPRRRIPAETPRSNPKDLIVRETLFEMYDQIFGEVDLSSVLRKTTAAVRRLFDAEQATIYLFLDDTRELESITTLDNIARAIRIPIGKQSLWPGSARRPAGPS